MRGLTDEERDVTVLDTNEDKVRSAVETYDVNGICGNGCIAEDLKEAGAATAGMIVAVTPSDEQNVLCCMIAKSLGAKYAVARVRDPAYSKQIDFMREKLGVDRLVNPERA
ncbi:MAG: NAD-binding protein, partial [Lachnospiraceae bacterium]